MQLQPVVISQMRQDIAQIGDAPTTPGMQTVDEDADLVFGLFQITSPYAF